jgi:hypothetical protein
MTFRKVGGAAYPRVMKSRRDRFGSCDAAIRSHLDPQEVVLAVGTCHDMTERRSIETTGVIAYVVVTDQSLRWTPDGDVRFEAPLAFADVIASGKRRPDTGTRSRSRTARLSDPVGGRLTGS